MINGGAIQMTRLSAFIKNPRGSFDTPFGGVPVELQVGKKWTSRATQIAADGQVYQLEARSRISSRETIQVPAGTFQTYLIETTTFTSNGGHAQVKSWFNPQFGVAIKREELFRHNGRPVRTERWELAELNAPRN
jgi:hypothetical protein